MTDKTHWCTGALPGDAPTHQEHENSLKALAANALRESGSAPTLTGGAVHDWCAGAVGASGAGGAQFGIKAQLKSVAKHMGLPAALVDSLSADDLAATAEQIALCEGQLCDGPWVWNRSYDHDVGFALEQKGLVQLSLLGQLCPTPAGRLMADLM